MSRSRNRGDAASVRRSAAAAADKACRYAAAAAVLLLVLVIAAQTLLAFDDFRRFLSAAERLEGAPFPVVPFLHPAP